MSNQENALPAAVQKQVDEADAIIKQMQEVEDAPAPEETPKEEDPRDVPQDVIDAAGEETPEPAPAPERTDWKQKFHVLQGKYNAEVPRLHAELKEAKQDTNGLKDQLNTLQATVASLQELQKKPPEPPKPLVTEEEVEQFGPDLIDLIGRVAKQELGVELDDKLKPVKASVKQVEGKVAQTETSVAQSAREQLYDRLDDAVSDWSQINKSEPFLKWLAQEDDFTGQVRGNLLRAAFDRNDADRVVKFFKSFQKEHVVETTDPSADAPDTARAEESAGKSEQEPQQPLDELVAPGTPKTGSTGAQEESGKGRIWTEKLINEFYGWKNEFVKKNPGKDLPKDMAGAERDLFKAQHEGRIR
jgi:hypothetical protein